MIHKSMSAFALVLTVVLISSVVLTTKVSAISKTDVDAIQRDSVHFAIPVPAVCGGTGTAGNDIPKLVGSSNEEKTYNYLRSQGLSAQQAAGVMGNLAVESGFIPNNQQNGQPFPTQGWGIAQWTDGRREALRQKVVAANLPYIADAGDGGRDLTPEENDALLAVQLKFLYDESQARKMRNDPNTVEWEGLKKVTTVADAVIYWEYNYERAGKPALANRTAAANEIFAKYGSSDGTGSGSSQACGDGQVVGGFSLPVDKKWYDQNKNWFTKPHHDYPSADIPVPTGTKVYAVAGGKVTKAPIVSTDSSYGQGVEITGADGTVYIYGHGINGGTIVGAKVGDTVNPGQHIMDSGNTGNSTGPHLHFEIRFKSASGAKLCPQNLFVDIAEGRTPNLESLPRSGCTN